MSTLTPSSVMLRTPFYQFHIDQGAKMVEFAGWEMPMLYGSIIQEHKQVRSSGGVFDVSHMGRMRFDGPQARQFLDIVCTRQILGMSQDQIRYSIICDDSGGCMDDVLVYRIGENEYMMVCNASNRLKLMEHFQIVREDLNFQLSDETSTSGMLAIQGPKVMDMIAPFAPEVTELKRYRFVQKDILGANILISRTGYTGEDGVEVIMPADFAAAALGMVVGDPDTENVPVKPVGLGARDSLRLEAGMALYGHEIHDKIDPISAGLSFAVKINKGDEDEAGNFIGQKVIREIAANGPIQKLVGLVLQGKRTPRQDMKVLCNGVAVGVVTSGCSSPTLEKPIAMAYVKAEHTEIGTSLQIDLGKTTAEAQVVKLPFYKAG